MGQKVCPIGFRLGITEEWRSRWYAGKKEFGDLLVSDQRIRTHIKKGFAYAGIPLIEIERTREKITVHLYAARPGVIIGKQGKRVDELREGLSKLCGRDVDIKIKEVERPKLSAQLVAEAIAEQLEKRASYRRTIQKAAEETKLAGCRGIKIIVSGRLAGAEMARRVRNDMGSIPLHTLTARVDYGLAQARTSHGVIGVRVWIHLGDHTMMGKETGDGPSAKTGKVAKKPAW